MFELTGYQILERIYTSPKRILYRGVRICDRELVILKCLTSEYPTPTEIACLQKEYEIAQNLDITGIVKPLALLDVNSRPILVLSDFGGICLNSYLTDLQLSLNEFLNISVQIVHILGELHIRNIVHRDIKPSNIIINPTTLEVRITDLAQASSLSTEQTTASNPILEGTLAYMSPEATGRMNRQIDYRTDFYSLGVTFYEILTKQLPHDYTDPMESIHAHIAKIPIELRILNPQIPLVLSDLVMKLLAKNPEDRYQSAFGIKSDLELCQTQLKENGSITSFILGQQDFSFNLKIPQKLYGRDSELAQLQGTFERVCTETTQMMLVTGYSGIGKSALVQEVKKPLVEYKGYFISGKFDQFQRNIPYSAFVQAFSDLMRQLLTEEQTQLEGWQQKVQAALGTNGQVIIDVIPEVELLIGFQLPVIPVPAEDAQNRFNLVFQSFVRVFASPEHPLIIFLDDLQWADTASLKLMQLLVTETKRGLFLIGAYRDNEVNAIHPLKQTVEKIQASGAALTKLLLSRLELPQVNQLIAETLYCSLDKSEPLAELLLAKTDGNPFFINQFLKSLYAEKLLIFDIQQNYWQWNLEEICSKGMTENVVDLLASKIQKQSEMTQTILKLAACIGNQFDLETLAVISKTATEKLLANLREAVIQELVNPVVYQENLRNIYQEEEPTNITYKFVHDRIQQAAYSLIETTKNKAIHWQIGQLLLHNIPKEVQEANLFQIVNQLNQGIEINKEQYQRNELALLNLKAAKKAILSAAYEGAYKYLKIGLELLGDECWNREYALNLEMYELAAEAAYVSGEEEEAKRLIKIILQHTRTVLDKIKAYEIHIDVCIASNQMLEALKLGLEVLNLLGIRFPSQPNKAQAAIKLLGTKLALFGRTTEKLKDLPEMTDLRAIAAARILEKIMFLCGSAYIEFHPFIVSKVIGLSLRYGNHPNLVSGYLAYANILMVGFGDIENGYRFGQLSVDLAEKFNNKKLKGTILLGNLACIYHWKQPLKDTLQPLRESHQICLETGNLYHFSYLLMVYCHHSFHCGRELNFLEQEIFDRSKIIENYKQKVALYVVKIYHLVTINLLGRREDPCSLSMELTEQGNERWMLYDKTFCQLFLCYLFGDNYQAAANVEILENDLKIITSSIQFPLFHFYGSLIKLALYLDSSKSQQKRWLKQVKASLKKIKKWAHHAQMNYLHKFYLVEAEINRVLGRYLEAMTLYDKAIKLAQANEYIHEEALANELAAKFYLSREKIAISRTYMQEARYCYQKWGAIAKVKHLDESYPQLLTQVPQETDSVTLTTDSSPWEVLDLTTVTQAAQLISGEISLDELLKKLMRIVLENAGARSGCLILKRDDTLFIEARGTLTTDWVITRESIPVEKSPYLPISVINYVARTGEDLVLNNASIEGNFIKDYYISSHETKSILCVPILGQGKLIGVLYLENNLTAGTFTPSRAKLQKILCSQAGIALENAKLYDRLEEYSQTLEQKVEARTQELQQEILTREQIEAALRLSEEKFSRAFRSSPNPVSLSRFSDGRLIEVNDSWLNVFEYLHSEVIGYTFDDLNILVDLEESEKFRQMLHQQGMVRNLEANFRTKSGEIKTFLFSAERIDIAGGTYIIAVGNDITERKQTELALESAKQAADTANRAKSTFLANMSHELRTPLNAILGFSQLMSRASNLSTEQQENLGIITRSGEHLLTLINQVLDLSKIEAERTTLNKTNFDIYRLLNDLEDLFKLKAKNKGLQLLFDIDPNVPEYVQIDEIKLRQVLLNIVSNAIKFTSEGGVSVRVKLEENNSISVKDNKEELSLSLVPNSSALITFEIEDTGTGIALEELETIFEAFGQTKIGQKSPEGTGLGLTIARSFIQLMGGEITVNSCVGKGSVFKFNIKVNLIESTDIQSFQILRRAIALAPNQPKYRLLIVDDRWDNRQLLVKLLSPFGFELYEASNGLEAIEIWEKNSPHLIFMDMRMPLIDGYEATKRIKATTKGQATAIIALTASSFDEERAIIISTGCDDFIRKPFKDSNIFDTLHKHIGVVFVYEEIADTTTLTETEPYIITKASFATLPSELVANLYEAISNLDPEMMQTVIEKIASINDPLANTISKRVKKFQYEHLLDLIQQSTDKQ